MEAETERIPASGAEPRLVTEARRIITRAQETGFEARLLGGVAIWTRASQTMRETLGREYADIDLAIDKKQSKQLSELLEELEYAPHKMFNATQGRRRLYFGAPDDSYHLDVFVDKFVMCHELELGSRLATEPVTLPAADLLLTKLQIAELNRKDASDTAMLLADHELADRDGPGLLNAAYVTELCSSDWGLYTTVTDNLQATESLLGEILTPGGEPHDAVRDRVRALVARLEGAPKSAGWRRRAKLGRRKRWYQTVDETSR